MDFDTAFTRLLGAEGGYCNNPQDPGGETKWGVSKRQYPQVDIAGLTQDGAKVIYKRDYWTPCRVEELPMEVRFDVFDGAVHSGCRQSVKWLQTICGVSADGVVGPVTLAAAGRTVGLCAKFNGVRLEFLTENPDWKTFGKGWARRIAGNLKGE